MQEQNKVFDVINPDSARPLILTCEHASAAIPSGYDNLGLSPMWLDTHIALSLIHISEPTRPY